MFACKIQTDLKQNVIGYLGISICSVIFMKKQKQSPGGILQWSCRLWAAFSEEPSCRTPTNGCFKRQNDLKYLYVTAF